MKLPGEKLPDYSRGTLQSLMKATKLRKESTLWMEMGFLRQSHTCSHRLSRGDPIG